MRNVCTHARTGIETGVLWRLIVRDVRCTVPDHSERRERKRTKERKRERYVWQKQQGKALGLRGYRKRAIKFCIWQMAKALAAHEKIPLY